MAVRYGTEAPAAARTQSLLDGDGHVLVGGNLSDPEVVRRGVEEAEVGLGHTDILVDNAGIAPR